MYEVAELIRRGAPLYLKFGLPRRPAIYPYGAPPARRRRWTPPGSGCGAAGSPWTCSPGTARTADMSPLGSRLPGALNGSTRPHNVPDNALHKRRRSRHNPTHRLSVTPSTLSTAHRQTEPVTDIKDDDHAHSQSRTRRHSRRRLPRPHPVRLRPGAARAAARTRRADAKGGTVGIAMPTKSSERWIADGKNVVKDLEGQGLQDQAGHTARTTPTSRSHRSRT